VTDAAEEVLRAKRQIASSSPRARRKALRVLSALGGEDVRPLIKAALEDPNRGVRRTALSGLMFLPSDRDHPAHDGDELVDALRVHTGDDRAVAAQLVKWGPGAGTFVWLGMRDRLLPHLDDLARSGRGRRFRRRAAFYARQLRTLTNEDLLIPE
jgi:HEAT repeat protein